jgi:hypothetical protein
VIISYEKSCIICMFDSVLSNEVSVKCKIGKVCSLKGGLRVTWPNLCFSECRVYCGCFGIFGK